MQIDITFSTNLVFTIKSHEIEKKEITIFSVQKWTKMKVLLESVSEFYKSLFSKHN